MTTHQPHPHRQIGRRATMALLAAPAVIGRAARAEAPVRFTLSVSPTLLSGPHFIAKERGYFAAAGLDVSIDTSQTNLSDALPLLARGEYAILTSALGASAFNAMHRGGLLRFLGTQTTIPTSGPCPVSIMVSTKAIAAGLKDLAGLKGQRVGIIGAAGYAEYDTVMALRAAGLKAGDYELVQMARNDMGPALANGAIAAGWGSEPLPTLFARQGIATPFPAEGLRGRGVFSIFANGDFVAAHPDACARFTAAFLKAARELDASGWQDAATGAILSQYTKIPAEVLRGISVRMAPDTLAPDLALAVEMEAYFRGRGVLGYPEKIDFAAISSPEIVAAATRLAG